MRVEITAPAKAREQSIGIPTRAERVTLLRWIPQMDVPFPKHLDIFQRDLCPSRAGKLGRRHRNVGQLFSCALDSDLKRNRLVSCRLQRDKPCSSIPDQIELLVAKARSIGEKAVITFEQLVANRGDTNGVGYGPYFDTHVPARGGPSCEKPSTEPKNGEKEFEMHGPLPGRPAAYYAAFVSRFPVYPRLAFAQSTVNDQNRRAPTCVLREIDRLRVHVNENALHFLAGRYHFS